MGPKDLAHALLFLIEPVAILCLPPPGCDAVPRPKAYEVA